MGAAAMQLLLTGRQRAGGARLRQGQSRWGARAATVEMLVANLAAEPPTKTSIKKASGCSADEGSSGGARVMTVELPALLIWPRTMHTVQLRGVNIPAARGEFPCRFTGGSAGDVDLDYGRARKITRRGKYIFAGRSPMQLHS